MKTINQVLLSFLLTSALAPSVWGQTSQTITWTSPAVDTALILDEPYPLTATASSGLTVTFAVQSGPAVITNGTVIATNTGTIVLVAEQAGDVTFSPATLSRTFNQNDVALYKLGQWPHAPLQGAESLHVVGDKAYVVAGTNGLVIYDLSNPFDPMTPVGRLDTEGVATGVFVDGTNAFIADGAAGLKTVNVSDPTYPWLAASIRAAGTALKLTYSRPMVYVAAKEAGMQIFQAVDPANPVLITSLEMPGEALNFAPNTGFAHRFVALNSGFAQVGTYDPYTAGIAHSTVTSSPVYGIVSFIDPLTYTAEGTNGVGIYVFSIQRGWTLNSRVDTGGKAIALHTTQTAYGLDVLNEDSLELFTTAGGQHQGSVQIGTQSRDFQIVSNRAYVVAADTGLHIINTADRTNPVPVWNYTQEVSQRATEIVGDTAYMADGTNGLQVIDVTDPAKLVRIGAYQTNQAFNAIAVAGDFAYVASGEAGLQIIDLSNPASLVWVGGYDTATFLSAVAVVGTKAYLASGTNGLEIIDITDPEAPVLLGGYDTDGLATDVQVVGNLAYVADGDSGLQIINVSNPASPTRTGGYNTSGSASAVVVAGALAYVADGASGLQIIDVSTPATPLLVETFATSGPANQLDLVGDLALVTTEDDGMDVIDISDPETPVLVANQPVEGPLFGVKVAAGVAYVLNQDTGLQTFELMWGVPQTLTFNPSAALDLESSPYTLSATASSELPVTFSVVSGPATVVDDELTLNGAGAVVVQAEQAGNAQFNPVTVTKTITVNGLPEEGPTLTLFEGEVLGLNYRVPTIVGVTYTLQVTDQLVDPNWETVLTTIGNGSVMSLWNHYKMPQAFYRVQLSQ